MGSHLQPDAAKNAISGVIRVSHASGIIETSKQEPWLCRLPADKGDLSTQIENVHPQKASEELCNEKYGPDTTEKHNASTRCRGGMFGSSDSPKQGDGRSNQKSTGIHFSRAIPKPPSHPPRLS